MQSKYNKPNTWNVFRLKFRQTCLNLDSKLFTYRFPLIGMYSLPKPQGPYTITADVPASIPFKNIFTETKSFELILDNPEAFATTTSLDKIKAKQVNPQIFLSSFLNDNL